MMLKTLILTILIAVSMASAGPVKSGCQLLENIRAECRTAPTKVPGACLGQSLHLLDEAAGTHLKDFTEFLQPHVVQQTSFDNFLKAIQRCISTYDSDEKDSMKELVPAIQRLNSCLEAKFGDLATAFGCS